MSTPGIYKAVTEVIGKHIYTSDVKPLHLDIGAGRGELITELQKKFVLQSYACDYHVERFLLPEVPIRQVDINLGALPYDDDSFDLVTASEVIEHLQDYRHLIREAHRLLKPGGLFVLTTPNVLNLKSRIRNLICGFADLFGPLPLKVTEVSSTNSHVSPIPYFYLAHSLLKADFVNLQLMIDRSQRTSNFWMVVLAPFLYLGWADFMRRERKLNTITPDNEPLTKNHISRKILTGRTLIMSAQKVL